MTTRTTTPQDITYAFDADELQALSLHTADGNFGLGFDPDCHFYNDGVCLTIRTGTQTIPEPASISLGLLGLGLLKRLRARKVG